MTFTIKHKRSDRPMVAEYLCPVHGRFEREVERDDQGDPPTELACTARLSLLESIGLYERCDQHRTICGLASLHVISATRGVRVRRVEAVRGNWQKPERKTWLDTRDLGEGMELEEFRDRRAAIRDEERRASLKELIDG